MSGPAVTVVDSGGLPVTPVASGAPAVTATGAGGVPVTFVENGTPVVLGGYVPPIPPVPGPLDFSSDNVGLTVYETDFDVAEPDIIFGMSFAYEGLPTFTVTHEGEPLEVEVLLGSSGGYGSLIAVGRDLTVEVGKIKVEASGGTFGPMFGRVNELGYTPGPITYQRYDSYYATLSGSFPTPGRVFLVSSTQWSMAFPNVGDALELKASRKEMGSDTIYATAPPPNGGAWAYSAGQWKHANPAATYSGQADILSPAPLNAVRLGWRIENFTSDAIDDQFSMYFRDSVENRSTNLKVAVSGDGVGLAYATYSFNYNQTSVRGAGNITFDSPTILLEPIINSGAIASTPNDSDTRWSYNNGAYLGSAVIVALIPPVGWVDFTLTAGDTGTVGIGYSAPSSTLPTAGSISNEPLEGRTLLNIVETTQTRVAFAGDVVAAFGTGYTLEINGTKLAVITPAHLVGSGSSLQTQIDLADYDMVVGNTYTIRRVPV